MNDFARLLGRQLARDLRRLPVTVRRRLADEGRGGRIGNVEEMRAAARRALPRVIFDFVDGAAGDEVTARRNVSDLAALAVLPRMLTGVAEVDLRTPVLDREVALPVIGAPMGLLGLVHPDGEIAVARALHAAGSVCAIAGMASHSIEAIAAVTDGPLWFQAYLWRDRGFQRELLARARAAGCLALVVTVDVPVAAARDRDRRNGFGLPPRITARSLVDGVVRPRWSRRFIASPRLGAGNAAGRGAEPMGMTEYIAQQFDPSVTWADLAELRAAWEGPLVVKGVLAPGDAREAVRAGAQAVVVSNHGGRQLDGAPSSIAALPAIVDVVGADAEVYLDGGVRRGVDALKALALGARAVLVGRPLAYGLGVAGEAGVGRVVAILRDELRTALALAGCASVAEASTIAVAG